MKALSFIHAADLHIDSPFKGVTAQSEGIADALRRATFDAYRSIIDLAIAEQVDFVVFAGDIYDGADRSIKAQLHFRDGLVDLAKSGIRAFVAHGNHDPLSGWSAAVGLPDGVIEFGKQVDAHSVERNGEIIASVAGISYQDAREDRNLAKQFAQVTDDLESDVYKIAVLHCNVGGDNGHANYAPCTVADLTDLPFDYWALGHVHERKILSTSPHIVYPGNTQGRSIRELGPRGCYLVKVGINGVAQLEFKQTDQVQWSKASISVDTISTVDQLDVALVPTVDGLRSASAGRPVVCRIEIVGRSAIYHDLQDNDRLLDLLNRCRARYQKERQFCWIEEIAFNCKPDVDLEAIRNRGDLLSFVLKEADAIRESAQLDELKKELEPLFAHRQGRGRVSPPTTEDLARLLEEAELLCVDMLEND